MKSSFLVSAVLAAPLLGGCLIIDADDGSFRSDFSNGQTYGTVYAADVVRETVSFTVSDNGCTDKSFFDVNVHKTDIDEFEVGVLRTRQDHCEVLNVDGTTVSWTFGELGIPSDAEITVLNRVRR